MIIKNIHIYGFGRWQDYQLELPDKKLIVVYGENEAGKSTIHKFLLFLLFGLPPKRREAYRPKRGGRLGGKIDVWTEQQGFFSIERIHEQNNGEAVCYLDDGKEQDEKWLREQLQRMDEKTFTSIFSFSANDLNYLHRVKEDEIGEVLLGMGMAGTSAIHQAEKNLSQKAEEWFKPQGKNPPINQQLNKLETMEKKLRELEKEEGQYRKKKENERFLLEQIEIVKGKCDDVEGKVNVLQRKVQALPVAMEYGKIGAELPPGEEAVPFPEEGLGRYRKLKEAILPIESEYALLSADKSKYERRLQENQGCLVKEDLLADLHAWENESEIFRKQSDYLEYQSKERLELQQKIIGELELLNTTLPFEELQDINLPFYTEEKWTGWRQEKETIQAEQQSVHRKKQELEAELTDLQEAKEKVTQEQIRQNETAVKEIQEVPARKESFLINASPFFLFGTGLLLVAAVLLLFITTAPVWLFVIAGMLLVLFTGALTWYLLSKRLQRQRSRSGSLSGQLPGRETRAQLQEEYTREHIQKIKFELLKLEERERFFEEQSRRLQKKVAEEEEAYPFLMHIDLEQWPKLYGLLNQVFYKYKQFRALGKSIAQLEEERAAFEYRTGEFLENKFDCTSSDSLVRPIETMQEKIAEQKMLRKNSRELADKVSELEGTMESCRSRLAPYQSEMLNLLRTAEVKEEEAFYVKGKKNSLFMESKKKMDLLYSQLKALLPGQELEELLSGENCTQWQLTKQLDELETTREELHSRLEEARQELADVRAALLNMESSGSLSELRHQFEEERSVLMKQAKDWALYRMAGEALAETKKVYRKKHFPAVMRVASDKFQILTEGKYNRVWLNEESSLVVQDEQGMRFDIQELSKGTHDQLYLALKLALSEHAGKKSPLPFLIDDAFVHFDAVRLETVPELLKDTASASQIIWFTCKRPFYFQHEEYGFVHLQSNRSAQPDFVE